MKLKIAYMSDEPGRRVELLEVGTLPQALYWAAMHCRPEDTQCSVYIEPEVTSVKETADAAA